MTATQTPPRLGTVSRIIPGALFDVRRPQRLIERSLTVYRRNPMIIITGFFEPLFYLLSIRIGLAELVERIPAGEALLERGEVEGLDDGVVLLALGQQRVALIRDGVGELDEEIDVALDDLVAHRGRQEQLFVVHRTGDSPHRLGGEGRRCGEQRGDRSRTRCPRGGCGRR